MKTKREKTGLSNCSCLVLFSVNATGHSLTFYTLHSTTSKVICMCVRSARVCVCVCEHTSPRCLRHIVTVWFPSRTPPDALQVFTSLTPSLANRSTVLAKTEFLFLCQFGLDSRDNSQSAQYPVASYSEQNCAPNNRPSRPIDRPEVGEQMWNR